MSITTADQMCLYLCNIASSPTVSPASSFTSHIRQPRHLIASTATTSSSHRPRPRLHRIDRVYVFIASTTTTSSSHRPRLRLHRIDRDHVFIASTASTSSSHRPRPRLHRIDCVYVFSLYGSASF